MEGQLVEVRALAGLLELNASVMALRLSLLQGERIKLLKDLGGIDGVGKKEASE